MKRYRVTMKNSTATGSSFIHYSLNGGTKKYIFKPNEPVIITDESAIEQLRKCCEYEIEEISEV